MKKTFREGLRIYRSEVSCEVLIVKDLLSGVIHDDHSVLVTIVRAFDDSKVGPAKDTNTLFYRVLSHFIVS